MPALPDRADGVDHETGGEVEAAGGLGVAERAPAELTAGLAQSGAGGPVDGAVDAAAAEKRRIRGIYHGMDVFSDDVTEDDLELGSHEAQRRFPDRGAARPHRTHARLGAGAGCPRREEETPCARVHDRA